VRVPYGRWKMWRYIGCCQVELLTSIAVTICDRETSSERIQDHRRARYHEKRLIIVSIMTLLFSIQAHFQQQTEMPHILGRDRLALSPAMSHAFQLVSNWPPTILISRPCRHDHNCPQMTSCVESRCSPSAQDSNDEMCPTCQAHRVQHQNRSK
jgi:hypothetical protein